MSGLGRSNRLGGGSGRGIKPTATLLKAQPKNLIREVVSRQGNALPKIKIEGETLFKLRGRLTSSKAAVDASRIAKDNPQLGTIRIVRFPSGHAIYTS